jgi:serine-type D-Ala-D-Ala carboxypeptidase (penicillin-binding protein 5/6)
VADADRWPVAEVERDSGDPSAASATDAESDPVLNVGRSAPAEETDPELPIATTPPPPSPPLTEQVRTDQPAASHQADSVALVPESDAGEEPAAPTAEPTVVEQPQAATPSDETPVSRASRNPAEA